MQSHSYYFNVSKRLKTPQEIPSTHNASSFISCIYAVWQRQNAAYPSRDVNAGIFILIHVVELADQFQVKSTVLDNLTPDLYSASVKDRRIIAVILYHAH